MIDHTDIVESLSEYGAAFDDGPGIFGEAAAEINRLRAEAEALRKALIGLDEAYCRAASPLSREERHEDRMRLIAARSALDATKGTT